MYAGLDAALRCAAKLLFEVGPVQADHVGWEVDDGRGQVENRQYLSATAMCWRCGISKSRCTSIRSCAGSGKRAETKDTAEQDEAGADHQLIGDLCMQRSISQISITSIT